MSREVTVAELAANLPEHLADVKNGETLTIVEEGQAIANITPSLASVEGVRYPFRGFDFGKRPLNLKTDGAQMIIDEREFERSGKKFGI